MSICVTDADAGLAFYRDVLGCTPLPRPDLGPGHWLDMPKSFFRVGFGWPTEAELRGGLDAISAALRQ